jgi:type II secretory pathway pseudopilin PulG
MKTIEPRCNSAWTRLEVLAVLAALALLAAVVLPALAGGKPRSDVAVCAANLRQLGIAALMYSMEEDGLFPPRGGPSRWPQRFLRFYDRLDVLRCPGDVANPASFGSTSPASTADWAPRSYLLNGWNDALAQDNGNPFLVTNGLPESSIPHPAQTILFGEKESFSGHFWMDLNTFDDYSELEQARHGARRGGPRGGGSNHAMVDGSVRLLLFGQAFAPTNLWAVTDLWRNYAP